MNKIKIDYIDFWIDDRGNRWDTSSFSESGAKEMSKSLISCYDCINCEDCKFCTDCIGCRRCKDCSYCYNCYKCENCISCKECNSLQDGLGVRDPNKLYQDLYFNN